MTRQETTISKFREVVVEGLLKDEGDVIPNNEGPKKAIHILEHDGARKSCTICYEGMSNQFGPKEAAKRLAQSYSLALI